MKKIVKTVYVADDGSEHDTAEAALRADRKAQLVGLLDSLDIYWRADVDTAELAGMLLARSEALIAILKT